MEKALKIRLNKSIEERPSDTLNIQMNLDDTHFAVGCSDGMVRIYAASSCHLTRTLNCRMTTLTPAVTSTRWRPSKSSTQNILFATTGDGFISHWHATSGKLLDKFQLTNTQVLCSDITVSGAKFALGCHDNTVKVFDENSRSHLFTCESGRGNRLGHSNRIFAVKWLDENLLVSGGWDNNVVLWDVRAGRSVGGVFGPLIAGESIDFCEDLLYTGSYDFKSQVQVWDMRNFSLVNEVSLPLSDRQAKVYSLQFVKSVGKEYLVAGCTGDQQIIGFDRRSMSVFDSVGGDAAVYCLDFCQGKEKFVSVNTEHLIAVYDLVESEYVN